MIPEPFHRIAGQPISLCIVVVRGRAGSVVVSDGVHEELTAKRRTAFIPKTQRRGRSERTSSAVPRDNDARGITTELRRVLRHPPDCEHAIIDSSREFVLGSEAIVDRDNQAIGAGAKVPAHAVVRIEAAEDEAAAVKEHEERVRSRRVRGVDPQGHRTTWPLHGVLAHVAHRCRNWHQADAGLVLRARLRDRQRVCGRHSRPLVEQCLYLRIYWHYLPSFYSGNGKSN